METAIHYDLLDDVRVLDNKVTLEAVGDVQFSTAKHEKLNTYDVKIVTLDYTYENKEMLVLKVEDQEMDTKAIERDYIKSYLRLLSNR